MDGQKPEQTPTPMQFVPGDTIRPQQQTAQAPEASPAPPSITAASLPEVTAGSPASAAPVVSTQPTAPVPSFPVEQPEVSNFAGTNGETITWTASEFIAHHKSSGWYTMLILASAIAATLVWLLTKDIVSALVVVFASVVLATYATRQPRQLSYQIDNSGLIIGAKHYSFEEFRSFSIVPEGAFSSIVFTPLRRFGTLVTIYYDPQDEERIIDALSLRLPHEERRPDPIDGMMRRIRF